MNINHIKTIARILTAVLSGAMLIPWFSSCVDEKYNPLDGDTSSCDWTETSVPVSLSVLPIQSSDNGTRAAEYIEASDNEKKIHDFWLIEYHENGTRIGLPRYYSEDGNGKTLPTELNILVPRRDCDKYTCVLIANTNDPTLFNAENRSKFSTLDELRTFEMSTHNQEHVFDPEHDKYLLMSGWTTIEKNPDTHNLSFDLIRNVCKVNVKLTAFSKEALVYKYFQWRDVPLGKAFPHGYIEYNQSVSRDWRQHLDDDPDNKLKFDDLCDGIDFYIPCNVWLPEGPKMPGNTLTESVVNEDPTHFVVVARELLGIDEEGELIESGEQYEFCLYPSKNRYEQFKFQPNHFYNMEMAINGLPDYENNDFVNLIEYKYLPESNCYMMKRDSKEFFAVPITRINKYWTRFGDGSELLDDDTEWVAEVIWQDSPIPLIEFTSFRRFQAAKDKSRLEGKGKTYYTLKGETVENLVPYMWDKEGNKIDELPMCFAFRTTGSGEGNVVVGVRKKVPVPGWKDIPVEEREYLWSWHIWVTDYDPYAYSPGIKWIYQEVPGGQVQRFPDAGMVGKDEWDDDWPCIMDRNLGATKTVSTREEAEAILSDAANGNWESRINDAIKMFGLYYQYGRKDPFPYPNQPVYDIKGNPIAAFSGSPNMIISGPHEAVPPHKGLAEAVRKGAIRRKATLSNDDDDDDDDQNRYTGYDPHPVRLAIKHPYKFYACASGVKMGELEALLPEDGEKEMERLQRQTSWTGDITGMSNWMSPGIETYSGKSLFDPCPVGWIMPDTNTFYGEVSTDTNVDYLEAIYSATREGVAEYYTATLLLYDLAKNYEFAYFPASGSRDGTNGRGLEGPVIELEGYEGPVVPTISEEDKHNIWRVGIKPVRKYPEKLVTVGLTNYLWTIGRKSTSMDAPASNFCVEKESSLGVPIRCIREFPLDF